MVLIMGAMLQVAVIAQSRWRVEASPPPPSPPPLFPVAPRIKFRTPVLMEE